MNAVRRRVSALRLAVVCCLLAASVAPAAAASPVPSSQVVQEAQTPPSAEKSVVVEYTFAPADAPERVTVTAQLVSLPRSVSEFEFTPRTDDVRTVSKRGFARDGDDFVWDGRTTQPSVTYTVTTAPDARRGRDDDEREVNRLGIASAENWTYATVGRLTLPYSYRYYGDDPGVTVRTKVTEGTAGPTVVFLGDYTTASRTFGDQTIRLVVPRAAAFDRDDRTRVFRTLLGVQTRFHVGALDRQVNVFVATAPVRRGGGAFPQRSFDAQDIWIRDDAPVADAGNAWLHEYVHTRQSYEATDRMSWFTEASAEYYAALLTLQQGRVSFDEFHRHVAVSDCAADRLVESSTWTNDRTPYTKGRRVLAALDARIRNESGGEATLQDVFRRLNDHPGKVSYSDFVGAVNAAATTDLSEWLDRYVRSTAAPSVPANPYVYTPPGSNDADADGLSDETEHALGTSLFARDTDGDGLRDAVERERPTDPLVADTDGDGLPDDREYAVGAEPLVADTDGDGLTDGSEVRDYGTNPTVVDTDADGLSDAEELQVGSDPTLTDTDDDGLADGREHYLGSDSRQADTDGDGLDDAREARLGTDPASRFTDGDQLSDDEELRIGTDPTERDTDGDELGDARERSEGTDPTDPDSDGDGIEDGPEVHAGTDPQTRTSKLIFFFASLF